MLILIFIFNDCIEQEVFYKLKCKGEASYVVDRTLSAKSEN